MKPGKLVQILLSLVVMVTLVGGNAQAALKAVGPVDPVSTLPMWYQDTNNLALQPCLDQNGMCLLPPPFDAIPANPPIATSGLITNANFPGESFYYSADALLNIETSNELAKLSFVLEAAFLGGVIRDTGIVFLRTDLQKMSNLTQNSTYRVTHPYGTFEFSTDGAGKTTGGGGVAIRQEDPAGTAALWMPNLMKIASTTKIGPFLTPSSGVLPTKIVGAETHTYIGDPAVGVTVTGSPYNTNFFRIERLDAQGVPVPGASWQTSTWFLAGRVFTGPIASDLTVGATYARDAVSNQVDIFATAAPSAVLTVSGTGIPPQTTLIPDTPATGKYFLHLATASPTLPTDVKIANSLDIQAMPPHPLALVDEVNITQATYNPTTRDLTIKAASRDKQSPPTLTVPAFAAPNTLDETGTLVKGIAANTIPPQTVTVSSTAGGSATLPVSVGVPANPPVAADDTASADSGTQIVINVLTNDTVTAPATLNNATVTVTAATGGFAAANLDGTVSYTPPVTPGTYTFTYTVRDNATPTLISNPATVTISVFAPATILTPANTSTLTGATQTFTWSNIGAPQYQLHIGSTPGADDLGTYVTTTNSATVNSLPTNGTTFYVRLYTWKGPIVGGFLFNDYTYSASGTLAAATMLTPGNATTLTGATQTFTWGNTGSNQYQVHVGSSPGADDLGTYVTTTNGTNVTGLPTNGSTIYVRLFTWVGSGFLYNDYSYTTAGTLAAATILTPTNSSSLFGATQVFTWDNAGAAQYQLHVGSTQGADNLGTYVTTVNSANVTALPSNGSTIYVRLYTWKGPGLGFFFNDYSYTSN